MAAKFAVLLGFFFATIFYVPNTFLCWRGRVWNINLYYVVERSHRD